MTGSIISDKALDQLFRQARSFNGWQDKDVSDVQLQGIVDLMKMGPTSANCQPVRLVFLKSNESKQQIKPHLIETNVYKVMSAPVVVIIGHDLEFYQNLPKWFPHTDAKSWFVGNDALIETTAFRNGTLQAAYLMFAARALGLDCGPMSGFDNVGLDKEFFDGTPIRSNFICGIGYGDPKSIFDRSPRPTFDDLAKIL
jgi:3-hydroxypropanoate dehydrogenase